MKRLTLASLMIATLTMTGVGIVAPAHAADAGNGTSEIPHLSDDPVSDSGDRIGQLGSIVYSSVYGGAEIDQATGSVDVYLTQLDPTIENALTALSAVPVHFFRVANSQVSVATAAQALARVSSAITKLPGDPVLDRITPDISTGALDVYGSGLSEASTQLLTEVAGSVTLRIHNSARSIQGPVVANNRLNDAAPWNGGDFIYDANTGTCSSGFAVKNSSGQNFLLTAAHCFINDGTGAEYLGDHWRNSQGYYGGQFGTGTQGSNAIVGYAAAADFTANKFDVGAIYTGGNGGSNPYIWTGPTGGAAGTPVDTPVSGVNGDPAVGSMLCTDGAFEGENCSAQVGAQNQCLNLAPRGMTCGLTQVTSTNGSQIIGSGDSGGPVFSVANGKAYAAELIEAVDPAGACSNWSSYYGSSRECGTVGYVTQIPVALSDLGGLTLMTH